MPPLIWTLTDGGAGMTAQALGLANCIAAMGGGTVRQNIVSVPAFANVFPPSWAAAARLFRGGIQNDAAEHMVVCCGGKSQAAALAAKKQFGAFAVCIQRPRFDEKKFNAIVAPHHDYSQAEINAIARRPDSPVLLTVGAVGMVSKAVLAAKKNAALQKFAHIPPPRTGLLIGGGNRAFALTPQHCRDLAAAVLHAAPHGGIMATASRRTGADNQKALAAAFRRDSCFFYDGDGDNPYLDILAAADRLLVTGDSVNMLSEACAAGKPTQIVELPQKPHGARAAKKFHRFADTLIAGNLARPWNGVFADWPPPGLHETARAAEFVWNRYNADHADNKTHDSSAAHGRGDASAK